MNYTILTYAIYMPVTTLLTIWVAGTLFKNGRIFLIEIFHRDETLADSVNKLLLVGFYLINIGYAVYTLKIWVPIENPQAVIEILSTKVGLIIFNTRGDALLQPVCLLQSQKEGTCCGSEKQRLTSDLSNDTFPALLTVRISKRAGASNKTYFV
jgi:hypothetical protein